MVQVSDASVIFAEATPISPDERLDLPSVEACDSKGSMKMPPVVIATIPIHESRAVPSGADAGGSPSSPQAPAAGSQEGAVAAAAARRRRPVWPIGAGLLIVVMLAVMIVFSVHAASPVTGPPPPRSPQTTTSQQPATDSSGSNGLIPNDDYNWEELDDKKIDDLMEDEYWYNSTYNATDDRYYEDDATDDLYYEDDKSND